MGGGLCAARGSANSSSSFRTTRTPNPQVPSYGLTTSGPTFSSGVNRSGCEATYVAGIGAPAAPRMRAAITLSRIATVTGYGFTMAAPCACSARQTHRDPGDLLQHVQVVLHPYRREVDEASVGSDDIDHHADVGERLHGLREDAYVARAVGPPEQEPDPQGGHRGWPGSAGARPGDSDRKGQPR